MEIYTVECRNGDGFDKIGEVKNDRGKVTLHFERQGDREMFEKFGPDRLTPEAGDRYIQAMIDQFRRSSGIFITKKIVKRPETVEHKITFNRACWRIPSVESAFDGILEGKPSEAEKKKIIEKTKHERAEWSPTAEAWEQFEQVKQIVGHEIVVQIWDSIMLSLEEEGPYPIKALCTGLTVIPNDDDKPQAYISLKGIRNIKTPDGYDGRAHLLNSSCSGELSLPLADIYEISCNGITVGNPNNLSGGDVMARYDRIFSKRQMTKMPGIGICKLVEEILSIKPECVHNEYAFDIHQREKSKLMVYHGGTRVLTIDFSKIEKGTICFSSKSYGHLMDSKLKEVTEVNDRNIDEITELVGAFLLKVVPVVNPRYYGNLKEGFWSNKLSIDYGRNWRPDMEWLIIDREAVLGFVKQSQKNAFYNELKEKVQKIKNEFQGENQQCPVRKLH